MLDINRKAIKAEARTFIGEDRRWLTMALACLPIYIFTLVANGGIEIVRTFSEYGGSYSVSYGSTIISLLLVPFTIASVGYYLNHLRGFNPEWKSLYHEGIDRYIPYFKVGVLTDIIIFLWSLLFIIPGIIKSFEYAFVSYIIHDNPNLTGKQARDLSSRMTEGYKMDLFILGFSFFFWYMLVGITFGIASLYVVPYQSCSIAMYYENLKYNALTTGIARPEEFGIMPMPEPTDANGYQAPAAPSYMNYAAPAAPSEAPADAPVAEAPVVNTPVETPVVEETVEKVIENSDVYEVNTESDTNIDE